jgi:hypothetical protein
MKPDPIRRAFEHLSNVPVPEDIVERARERPPAPPTPPGHRALVAFVALAVFAAAGAFAWSAFRPGSSPPEPPADVSDVPSVVRIDCGAQGSELLTPEVQVQSDGVLIHVEEVGNAVGVEGSLLDEDPGTGTWAFDFGDGGVTSGFEIALALPPGEYVVRCAEGDFLAGAMTSADGEVLKIVDPGGIWHDHTLSCPEADRSPQWTFGGGDPSIVDPSGIEDVIRNTVPGIAPSDLIEYAAYPGAPRGEEWQYRILRGGAVVARLRLFEGGGRWTIVEACSSSGIGAEGTSPVIPGEPSPVDAPVIIQGVPFPVCDVDAIQWRYGADGIGQAFTFEEAPESGCQEEVEGHQYVGVTTEPAEGIHRVDAYFGPLTRCTDKTGCWLYAGLELEDGDPVDELLLGTNGSPGAIEVWFFDVGTEDDAYLVRPFEAVCPPNADCDPLMIRTIDWVLPGLAGLSCGRYEVDGSYTGAGFYEWTSESGGGWIADEWVFSGGRAEVLPLREEASHGDPLDTFTPANDGQICLQPAFVAPAVLEG